MNKIIKLLIGLAIIQLALGQPTPNNNLPQLKDNPPWGKLIGRVVAVWLRPADPGWASNKGEWQMRLVEPFSYEDPTGQRWDAPVGCPIDGASIPKLIWSSLAGTPYTGQYREASVVHDRYCDEPTGHTFRQIAHMFYQAMRCEGTGLFEAGTKYYAVLKYGPQDPQTHRKPSVIPGIWHRQLTSADEATFFSLVNEAGPQMSDSELASFYSSLQEQPLSKTPAGPTAKFVLPTDKVKETQSLRSERKTQEIETQWNYQMERSTSDWNFWKSPSNSFSYPKQVKQAAIITTDKGSEQFYRDIRYIAKKADTISAEEIENVADNGAPKEN